MLQQLLHLTKSYFPEEVGVEKFTVKRKKKLKTISPGKVIGGLLAKTKNVENGDYKLACQRRFPEMKLLTPFYQFHSLHLWRGEFRVSFSSSHIVGFIKGCFAPNLSSA